MRQNRHGERRFWRLFGRFSVVLFACSVMLHAETFNEFRKNQLQAYSKFKDERDKAFEKYLKTQWEAYKKFVSPALYEKPKPVTIPKAEPKPVPKVGPKVLIKVPKKVTPPQPKLPKEVAAKHPQQVMKNATALNINFFGTALHIYVAKQIQKAKFYPTNQKGITNYFDTVATADYNSLIKQIKEIKKSMQLNDWGVYLLVDAIGKKLYKYDDEANLFSWFVFNKLGYAVKVGLANGRVVTMFYSKRIIYSTPNFKFGSKRFYVLSLRNQSAPTSVYSYKQNYPGATKAFDLSLAKLPAFAPVYKTKHLRFTHEGKKYEVSYKYNQNLIDFFATYPQADYAAFFNAAVDPVTYASIAASLRKYINDKRAAEAMNIVLHFVQTAFAYETDQKQFGREKVMFAEETLYYKASDCEDRAVLYAFLTKELFSVPVLGVKYPNHMATALYVPLNGDKIKVKGKEFVIADPTYIHATIGEAMPQFKGKMPEDFIFVSIR